MKISDKLGHIIVPMITPFDRKTGDVNYKMAEELVDHLINNNYCDSIAVCGTTGEFFTLTSEERVKLFEVVYKKVNGRVPLVAGTGAASTREAIALTKAAEKIGFDTVMVVAPYYCKPNQAGLYNHFKAVAESTKCNVLLYNIPIFTGVNLEPATVRELAKIKNVVGIKDEAGINPTQMTDFILATKDINPDFTVYNGDDQMILCGIVQGAAGVVSGASMICGHLFREMIKAFEKGDNETARKIFDDVYPLLKSFGQNGRIIPNPILRACLEEMGLPIGPARMPLDEPTAEEVANAKKELVRIGIKVVK